MKKEKIKKVVKKCRDDKRLCRAYFKYCKEYWYLFPLLVGDKLFLSAEEDDFLIDGYQIRRFRDLAKVKLKDGGLYDKILAEKNIIAPIETPDVDITSWESVFTSLFALGRNVIVERESLVDRECIFVIGRIEKVSRRFARVRHFDADGVWDDEPYKIPYNEITSLTFNSRYLNRYSEYVDGSYPKK